MTVPLLGRRRQAQRRNPAADPGEGFGAAARAPYYERVFGTTILEHAGENEGGTAASRGGLGRTAERFPPGGRIGSPTGAARPLAALARLEAAMRIATRRLLLPLVAVLAAVARSEEHTSELQSRPHLVCRLLLEKKKKNLHHDAKTQTKKNNKT